MTARPSGAESLTDRLVGRGGETLAHATSAGESLEPEAAWRSAVAKVLKGAGFDTLVARSLDGLPIGPLYPKAELNAPKPWRDMTRRFVITQRIDHPDPVEANRQAGTDIGGGATGLTFSFAGALPARGGGIEAATADDYATLLDGLPLDRLSLRLELAPTASEDEYCAIAEALKRRGFPLSALDLDAGLDPLGEMVRSGGTDGVLRSSDLASPLLRADDRPHHEAGASEAQELAAVLATAVAALRACEGRGLSGARDAISFTLVADADHFLTVAKLRALRRLWARVEQACSLEAKPIRLHAETAWRMLTRRDGHTNILRNTIAAASAILGGADSLTVLPHTSAMNRPDAFARRVARNTALVLLEEAHLGRVADPAAGSGAFEALTDALCVEAWGLFQSLEREGGLAQALRSGTWQRRIGAVQAARQAAFASGNATIVGVTRFAPPAEARGSLPPPLESERAPSNAMPSWRDAEAFEGAP